MRKKYQSPDFEFVKLSFSASIMSSEPEGLIHENDPGVPIED